MDWGALIISLIIDLIITVFFYLFVPVCFCIRNKPLTKGKIKKIVIINGIVVWLILQIIAIVLNDGEPSKSFAVFLWSAVAHRILKKCCLKKDVDLKENHSDTTRVCLSPLNETPKRYGDYAISGSDIRLNKEERYSAPQKVIVVENKRPSSNKSGALVIVILLLIISVVINVVQFFENEDYAERNEELHEEYLDKISELEAKSRASKSFYEEHAVCVSGNNPNIYHKYGCILFDDSEFWIFNIEYADYMGYEPCPYCCK